MVTRRMKQSILKNWIYDGSISLKTGPYGTKLKALDYVKDGIPVINVKNIGYGKVIADKLDKVGDDTCNKLIMYQLKEKDIVFGRKGAVDRHAYITSKEEGWILGTDAIRLRVNTDKINSRFLSYYFLSDQHKRLITSLCSHGTPMASLNQNILEQIEIPLPDRKQQDKIVSVLESIDSKIEINEGINKNLLTQILAVYHKLFVETENDKRKVCRLGEVFKIRQGMTPPRKECDCFSKSQDDCVWATISDMRYCGTFFLESKEHLAKTAIEKYSVNIVPDNTVILSYKLSVGRVAITVGEISTNEAIASFISNNDMLVEYLYCYLKTFEFSSLGSTSLIGNAINLRILKGLKFYLPEDEELTRFRGIVCPMFKQIKRNQIENGKLLSIRDKFIPKLMSGQFDLSNL